MTLDAKALEAAGKAYRARFPLYKETDKTVDPWLTEYMTSAIRAYLDAADLVERRKYDDMVRGLMHDNDEARREARALDAGLDVAVKKIEQEKAAKEKSRRENDVLAKQIAALREALKGLVGMVEADPAYPNMRAVIVRYVKEARAALTDTAAAASEWQRVPEGRVVVPIQRWPALSEVMSGDCWQRILAAAPKAGEPEDGG